MEVPVYNPKGRRTGKTELPSVFTLPPRSDLIHRVFVHQQSHTIQPQGRDPLAGRRRSAEYFGTGHGLARIPRIKSPPHRGRGALVAMARGGRKPHVTTPEKKIYKKINKKERSLAVASATAATANPKLVAERGHIVDGVLHIPLVVTKTIEDISTTAEFMEAAKRLGLMGDIMRVRGTVKTVGGKASWRGRRLKHRVGPLIIYGEDKGIAKAGRNVLGVDLVSAADVSVIHLAPGGVPGRLTVWDRLAVELLEKRLKGKIRMVSLNV